MAEKRKDSKGRILRAGEGQRPNLTYYYRFRRNSNEKWSYIYAPTLNELREKEVEIQRDLLDGIDYVAGETTVLALVERYINLRRGLTQNSQRAYGAAVNRIRQDPFGQLRIKDVKRSEAKTWFVSLHDQGMKQNTIGVIHSVLRPAFEMAVEDDMIRKNPFKFKLSDVVPKDANVRNALTKAQQERYLEFVRDDGGNYYNDIVILLGTGLRVSELYGLTLSDVDFERRCIRVTKQLCRTAEKPYFVTSPKTKSGIRVIPMTDSVYMAFRNVVEHRGKPKIEMIVDGYSGFLFLDKDKRPKVAMHLENYMRGLQKRYLKSHGNTLPTITPHVLRHTFCTNAQQAMLDVKSLQYIMGHSTASVTLDVYTHSNYESAERAFRQIAASL